MSKLKKMKHIQNTTLETADSKHVGHLIVFSSSLGKLKFKINHCG